MNSIEIYESRIIKKRYDVLIDQYFFLLEKIGSTTKYTRKEIALFKLNLWQVSRDPK